MRREKKIKSKKQIVHATDKVTLIIIIIHFMIMTLSERPKLHICRGWKHPSAFKQPPQLPQGSCGLRSVEKYFSPSPLRGSFHSFPFSFRGFAGCGRSLENCLGIKKNFVLQTLRNISRGLQPQLLAISPRKYHPLGGGSAHSGQRLAKGLG